MKVLLVEDDRFYSQAIAELLSDHNLHVVVAYSADEAMGMDASSFAAAVIDVMLPNNPTVSGITEQESRGGFLAGVCVARRLLKQNQHLRVALMTSSVNHSEAATWAQDQSISFVGKDDARSGLLRFLRTSGLGATTSPRAFIVHGHDDKVLLEVKNYIQNTLHWSEPVILREQPNSGRTIIEQFEDAGLKVDCVFVLLTPDDIAVASDKNSGEKRRSRQNVIFELGFFYALLGRTSGRVFLLYRGEVELPSDLSGIVWIDVSHGVEAAGEQIRKEVKAAFPAGL